MGAELRFDVLGSLRAIRDGGSVRLPGSAVVRRLLGVLLLAHEPLPADRLTGLVWGERVDAIGRGSLHVATSRLREWLSTETVGALAVRHEGSGYVLAGDAAGDAAGEAAGVDLRRFRSHLARAASAADDAGRHAALGAAMALVRGPVLADLGGVDRDDPLLRSVEDDVRSAGLAFAALALATGHPGDATGPLQVLAAARPFDEPVHARLIDLLASAGRPAEALMQYEALRERLAEQLGVDPSADVRTAHLGVLQADRPGGRADTRTGADQHPSAGRSAAGPPTDPTPAHPTPTDPTPAHPTPAHPTPAHPTPAQLPPDLPDYTGNEVLLAAVCASLTAPGPVRPVVIAGQGGVGKSALAVHVAHRLAAGFPDGQLFVPLGGSRAQPVRPEDALRRVLRVLGDDAAPPPVDLDDCVQRYRARLDGRRLLVVLDDAAGAAQVRPFVPAGSGCAVLVSTRARLTTLPGASHVSLDLMAESEATALLERILGPARVAAEPAAVSTLVRQCAQLPLALRVVGARLAARPHWAISRLVERMSDERRRLDELAIDDLAVRAGLAVSYRGLDPQAQRALRAVAFLDPPDVAAWTVAALLQVSLSQAEDAVEQLLDMRLVEVSAGGGDTRYRLHDLVRLYARERAVAEDAEADLRAGVTRALGLALVQVERRSEQLPIAQQRLYRLSVPVTVDDELIEASRSVDPQWFDAEEPGLIAAVERAADLGMDDLACALADAMIFASFGVHNNFTGWNRAHQAALGAARASENVPAEAVIECGLGQLRYKEDRFAEAKVHFGRALELFAQVQDDRGRIVATNGLGTVARELGEHDVALPLHQQAVAALERLGDDDGAAHAHYGLGYMHRELAHDDLAFEHLHRSVELYRAVGNVRGEATSVRGLGLVHRARGELDEAETYCSRADLMATAAGDRLLTCYTRQALAKVWIRQGRPQKAVGALEQTLAACGQLHDRLGVALTRRTIGELHLVAGRPEVALDHLSQAGRLWKELEMELWQARTLRDIGAAHAGLGDADAAHAAWTSAQASFERFGTRERNELSSWRRSRGCTCPSAELAFTSDGCAIRRP